MTDVLDRPMKRRSFLIGIAALAGGSRLLGPVAATAEPVAPRRARPFRPHGATITRQESHVIPFGQRPPIDAAPGDLWWNVARQKRRAALDLQVDYELYIFDGATWIPVRP